MTIRALIVDDEAPARERVATLLADHPDVTVVATCANGPEAIDAIDAYEPDVVFLDVQMPEMSGFEVIDAVGLDTMPAVVFVTAYDQFALRAFDARALDYLLKPFTAARFAETIQRIRRGRERGEIGDPTVEVRALLTDVLPPLRDRRFAARDGDRFVFLRYRDVDWIEGAGNYVRLHAGGRRLTLRATLRHMAERLQDAGFRRIHHSCIVNVERIAVIERQRSGGFTVLLEDGTRLETSRSYENQLVGLL